jgi:hypothetical protein
LREEDFTMPDRSIHPPAPATFLGLQEGYRDGLPLAIFKLTAPVGDHPIGSTVAHTTLEKHGYEVPRWVMEIRAASSRRQTA